MDSVKPAKCHAYFQLMIKLGRVKPSNIPTGNKKELLAIWIIAFKSCIN